MASKKWTHKSIQKVAKLYSSRKEFKINRSGAYAAALRLGIMDEVCSHMPKPKMPWTKEMVIKEASKYSYKGDFAKAQIGAYEVAIKLGIIDELFPGKRKPTNEKWTKGRIKDLLDKYTDLSLFRKEHNRAYIAMKNKGWIDELTAGMTDTTIKKWTIEELEKEASLYTTRTSFNKGSKGAYMAAWNLNILDDICKHMTKKLHRYTDEEIKEELELYTTVTDLRKFNRKIYDHAVRKNLLDKYGSHLKGRNTNIIWTGTLLKKEALKYSSKKEFKELSSSAYNKAASLGILQTICKHMSDMSSPLPFNVPKGESGLYFLNLNNTPVYIGKSTSCVRSRVHSHESVRDREFDEVVVYSIESKADIDVLELYYINKFKPIHNKDSNSGDTLSVTLTDSSIMNNKTTYKRIDNE